MKSIKTLQCLNLKKMWMCSSCAKLVQINFHVDWSGIKKFEILDWINEIQTNDQDLSYNIHQWKMKQLPRFYEADRQIQIFRVFVMIIHDKYKWYAKVILFKNRYSCWFLNEFCGHFMVFMRSFCVILVRNSFADVVSHYLSLKIYQNSTKTWCKK